MKSKNILEDIKSKSIKEAQLEIQKIIENLENIDTSLENSMEQYNRMMQLNNHIQNKFRQKAKEIKQLAIAKNKKKISRKSK